MTRTPDNKKLISSRWVFTIKRDEKGQTTKHKARLVARGYEQTPGIDFDQTYSPVSKLETIRIVLAIAALNKMSTLQFDVSTAFLHGELDEKVFMKAPQGVKIPRDSCLLVKRALYGLRQSPRAWNSKFDCIMRSIGFKATTSDPCLYFKDTPSKAYLVVYVDDGIIIGEDSKTCQLVLSELQNHLKLRNLPTNLFLGMLIRVNPHGISINQSHYVDQILHTMKC